jgi:hypothetical protein
MSSFVRRFLTDPGEDVLLEIESVNILDLEPQASITGVGTGTVLCLGEFEDGPYNTPTEVTSATDLKQTFGTFGYTYGGVVGSNPCALERHSDSAIAAEYWNGNGIVQLSGKKFKRLVICRVDTSVGQVSFTRCAFLTGVAAWRYNLEPAQTLVFNSGAGDLTSTFNATAAVVTGVAGAFPTLFVGGETLTLGWDAEPNFTVTFLSTDQSNAQVAARINQYAGFTFCTLSGGQLRFTARQKGTGSAVRIVSGSAGVLTALGLSAATTNGTGNVANIDAVTIAEVHTVCSTTDPNVAVTQDNQGRIRMTNTGVPGTGTLVISATSTATAFGFPLGTTASAASGTAGVLPAGTRVRNGGGTEWVTTQATTITAASAGPYTVLVRPALDDGSVLTAGAGTVTVMYDQPDIGAFTVINLMPLSAALTEAQLDVRYQTALDSTLDLNTVAKEVNITFSARQSNAVRRALKQNALDASANGLFGRMTCIRPPLGVTRTVAESTTVEPGIGAYRDQRVVYCYPGARTLVPIIATRGTAAGKGFTVDGIVDVGADGFAASIMSQLPPEENPGQQTPFLTAVVGLESSPNAAGFTIVDYTNFRRLGIAALRIDGGEAFFQSGVTSVDPQVHPNLRNIARRRMADYIQDSLAARTKASSKKLNTVARRKAIAGEIRAWMNSLLSTQNRDAARIDSYSLDLSANVPRTLGLGMYRLILNVRTLSSLDSIVLQTTIGESVEISEAA